MDTDAKGQLGGIECSKDARQRMARDSGAWKCAGCGKSNVDVMKEREKMVEEIEEKEGKRKEDEIPEELRLAYRDELGKADDADKKAEQSSSTTSPASTLAGTAPTASNAQTTLPVTAPQPTRTIPAPQVRQTAQPSPDQSLAWLDTCIYGLVAALLFMVLKKFA